MGIILYCPECEKEVPEDEVMPVVVEVYDDGTEVINRAFHFPNCKSGTTELEFRDNGMKQLKVGDFTQEEP